MADRAVIGVGPAGWDAGTDLFLDVARRIAADPTVTFRWYGRRSRGVARWLDNDVSELGLTGRVDWVADSPPSTVAATAPACTIVVIPARTPDEADAAQRAAPADVPVVAFDLGPGGSGIPFPDTASLADRVREILDGPGSAGGTP